jgi:hypothetical protein
LTYTQIIFILHVLNKKLGSGVYLYYEKDISAQQNETNTEVRVQGTDEDAGRTPCADEAKTKGKKKVDRFG